MLGIPLCPARVTGIMLQQKAKEAIVAQPRCMLLFKGFKLPARFCPIITGDEFIMRDTEQFALERLDGFVIHRPGGNFLAQILRRHLREHVRAESGHLLRRARDINRVESQGADGIVRAVVPTGFIHREQLQNPHADRAAEIHGFTNRLCVADAQVAIAAQGKNRHEQSCEFFFENQWA
ncbi:hypothetical protein QPK87_36175 [Kamptonema cortianum]|nr:hypothetical protein [Kamptonema cortianum]